MSTPEVNDLRIAEMFEGHIRELGGLIEKINGARDREDLSFGQYKVISTVHDQEPISIGRLGNMINSAQSTTSEMIARLTRAGLIEKVGGLYDARVVMVKLTDAGRQLLRRRRKRINETYQVHLDKLNNTEKEEMLEAMKVVNHILSRII